MPMTIAGFPRDQPVLIGSLSLVKTGPTYQPTILMTLWDPFGRQHRRVPMPSTLRPDSVAEVASISLDGRTIMLACTPDPTRTEEAQAVIDEFKQLNSSWKAKSVGKRTRKAIVGRGPEVHDRRVTQDPSCRMPDI